MCMHVQLHIHNCDSSAPLNLTAEQDGQLLVEAVHYPTLLRCFDALRGRPASRLLPNHASSVAAAGSSSSNSSSRQQQVKEVSGSTSGSSKHWSLLEGRQGTLTCCVAGLQDVQPQVQQLLQRHLDSTPSRVHTLRVFALTQQGHNGSSTGAAAAAAQPQDKQEDPTRTSDSSSSSTPGSTALDAAAEPNPATAAGTEAPSSSPFQKPEFRDIPGVLWAELSLLGGLSAPQLKAAAKALSSSSSSSSNAEQPQAIPAGSSWPGWLLLRYRDAALLLLGAGLARLPAAEDWEWLGVRPAAVKAYTRAYDKARSKRLGLHAKQQQQQQQAAAAGLLGSMRRWWRQRRGTS
uniref:Uncharacterized protein n=1 Tax=Tetradesmus obliquus TaxID=3088 RepID=A0A383VZW7_TETOB|eukprot:jgi/Sobl393_1/4752/SZX70324.1